MKEQKMNPYVVEVTQKRCGYVVVWAKDRVNAAALAGHLYSGGKLHCDMDDFACSSTSVVGTLQDYEKLDHHPQYDDHTLENLWDEFGDLPMDPETEEIEVAFMGFPAGTHREEIWQWFDEYHSKGVGWLMNERICR